MTGVVLNLLALGAVVAYVMRCARPATEAVRMRNAWLVRASRPDDFAWTPPNYPAGFRIERRPATREFRAIVDTLGIGPIEDDWTKALALAGHLTERAEDKGAVRADPLSTYHAIRKGYGYCADFVKVFLALAHAAGLDARQWAFSFDGFGGHGHTVVEVFDRKRRRWLMLDVHNNLHFADAATGEPLGALETRAALKRGGSAPALRPNGRGRPGYVHEHKALEYYRRGVDQWYLIWGNAVVSYYANPLVATMGAISRPLAHVAANVVGVQPQIRIVEVPENASLVRRMFALQRRLRILAWVFVSLVATLVVQLTSPSAMRLAP